MNLKIAFNIQEFAKNIFLPSAWLVKTDKQGQLSYLLQKATSHSIRELQYLPIPAEQRCLEIIDLLSPKSLEKKFLGNGKKNSNLLQLLDDKVVVKTIRAYVNRHTDLFLETIVQHNLPICYEIESKAVVHLTQVEFKEKTLLPRLSFRKVSDGIVYQLKFEENGKIWQIHERNVVPILNEPAWLLLDKELIKVPFINALMVVPFKDKYEIHVSKAHVRTYFETFILKMVSKVETLESEGFDIVEDNLIQRVTLHLQQHFMLHQWGFALNFEYKNAKFAWFEQKKGSNNLVFSPNDEIVIHKTIRQPELEQQYVTALETSSLITNDANLFFPAAAKNTFQSLVAWLIQNKQLLENQGFVIEKILFENKEIQLRQSHIQLNSEQHNDWFDLKGDIVIGEWSFPFVKFINYLKTDNPYFPLPDGTFFIIPEEWFTKYQGIAQFAKIEGNNIKITKSQSQLLATAGLENKSEHTTQSIDYQVSAKINATLRPYQLAGFQWLMQHYDKGLGACLADDMGLGKTLQTIAVIQHAKEQKAAKQVTENAKPLQLDIFAAPSDESFLNPVQVLIILPASLVYNWKAEFYKFAPHLQIYEHTGNKRHQDLRVIKRHDVVLTTYQTALKDADLLGNFEWEYIILDESHYIKNPDSQVFKAISEFRAKHKISLSGTPIENSLSDLWAQMQFINPGLLGNYNYFKTHFLKSIEKSKSATQMEQLRSLVSPYLLRRTKEEVAKDLPELLVQTVYVDMSAEQAKRYEQERSAARNLLLHFDEKNPQQRQQVFTALLRLRQIANHVSLLEEGNSYPSGKLEEVISHLETIQKSKHKTLIFSSFTKHLDIYKDIFAKAKTPFSYLTGSLSLKEREATIADFKENEANQTFLISLKAGGVGLNLTEAAYVFILDPWWNPQAEMQAIARAHRIGQDKPVIAMKFITRNTIEEKILALQAKKARLAADILDSPEQMSLSKSDLEALI